MVFDVVVFGDMEFLGGFLSFPIGRFSRKRHFKRPIVIIKVKQPL